MLCGVYDTGSLALGVWQLKFILLKVLKCKGSHAEPNNYTNDIGNNNVNVLNWPSLLPDLAPVESIWAEVNTRVYARQPPPIVTCTPCSYPRVEQYSSETFRECNRPQ